MELILVRHAKSSWKDPSLPDHERPLNKRGKNDAPMMAAVLKQAGVKPDLIISSTAERAKLTAEYFAEILEVKRKKFILTDGLYFAGINEFLKTIRKKADKSEVVMIFSHNPGITEFANYICGSEILNIPTCGIVRAQATAGSWEELGEKSCRLISFDYPKNHY